MCSILSLPFLQLPLERRNSVRAELIRLPSLGQGVMSARGPFQVKGDGWGRRAAKDGGLCWELGPALGIVPGGVGRSTGSQTGGGCSVLGLLNGATRSVGGGCTVGGEMGGKALGGPGTPGGLGSIG